MTMAVTVQSDEEQGGAAGRVLYIDTEGTFRPQRVQQIAAARGLASLEDGSASTVTDNILVARCWRAELCKRKLTSIKLNVRVQKAKRRIFLAF